MCVCGVGEGGAQDSAGFQKQLLGVQLPTSLSIHRARQYQPGGSHLVLSLCSVPYHCLLGHVTASSHGVHFPLCPDHPPSIPLDLSLSSRPSCCRPGHLAMWPELSAGPPHAWAELEQGLHEGQSTTSPPHPALTHTAVSLSLGPVLCHSPSRGSSSAQAPLSSRTLSQGWASDSWWGLPCSWGIWRASRYHCLPWPPVCIPQHIGPRVCPFPQLLAELGLLGGAAEAPGALPVLT